MQNRIWTLYLGTYFRKAILNKFRNIIKFMLTVCGGEVPKNIVRNIFSHAQSPNS